MAPILTRSITSTPPDQGVRPRMNGLGDKEQFREAAQEHRQALLRVAMRMVDEGSAEDLVQEALTRAFRQRHDFQEQSQSFTWFCGILLNLCRSELRRRKIRRAFGLSWLISDSEAQERPVVDPGERPEQEFERLERRRLLHEALQKLPEKLRSVLILTYFEQLSGQQAAAILGLTEAALWQANSRARKQLKKHLEGKIS